MKTFYTFVCFSLTFSIFSQYESGVTYPDTSSNIVDDTNIPRVNFAHSITVSDLKSHLTILASDEMGGRELGTEENIKAAHYLADRLNDMGYTPINELGGFFQNAVFTKANWETSEMNIGDQKFRHLWDFVSFPTDGRNVTIEDEKIIFLGYGIDDSRYSDYRQNSVRGKTILIYEGEPKKNDGTYWISKSKEPSFWSETTNKLKIAKRMGVKNVLIITQDFKTFLTDNRRKALGSVTKLGPITEEHLPPGHIYLSSSLAQKITGEMTNKIIAARDKINTSGQSNSIEFNTDLQVKLIKNSLVTKGANVLGYLPGSVSPEEVVIVSAHYDHIGKRGDYIFNGADDNGSGTSTLLEIAEAFILAKKEGYEPRRSILFLWVTGEEKGLLGSQYYTENPVFDLDNTIADVNIDMVGRIDNRYVNNPDYIYVIGSDRISPELHKINEAMNQKYSHLILDYKYNDEKDPNRFYYRSDHYNFAKNGIPSVFFFNGVHADYHKDTDTVDKIHFGKMEKIGRLIFQTVWELANGTVNVRTSGLSSDVKTQP